jgi:hypothetical protein
MTSIFPIIPAGPRSFYLMVPVFVILVGVFLVVVWTLYGSQRASLRLSSAGIAFQGDVWGRKTIPLRQIRARDARIVNLDREGDLKPASRRMGTALPGYASGWFRLRNGEKALLYLTDRTKVVYIPTDLGYSIMTSVAEPERLIRELQATGPT